MGYAKTFPSKDNLHKMVNVCFDTTTPTPFYVRERIRLYKAAIDNKMDTVFSYYQSKFGYFPSTKFSQILACTENPYNTSRPPSSPPRRKSPSPPRDKLPRRSPPRNQQKAPEPQEKCPQPPLRVQREPSRKALNLKAVRTVEEHNDRALDEGEPLIPLATSPMNQVELGKLHHKLHGNSDEIDKEIRKQLEYIQQHPDLGGD